MIGVRWLFTRNQFAVFECPESFDIDQYTGRLVKRPDQILAEFGVDRRLATNRRIDHRQKGRRNLQKRNPAQIDGRRKPGQIADHAAAQCNDRVRPLKSFLSEKFLYFSPSGISQMKTSNPRPFRLSKTSSPYNPNTFSLEISAIFRVCSERHSAARSPQFFRQSSPISTS